MEAMRAHRGNCGDPALKPRSWEVGEEDSAADGSHRVLMRWRIVLTVILLVIIHVN